MPRARPPADFAAALKLLVEHRVDFIIVGGLAATAHGSARVTYDLDIVYSRRPDNIDHMVSALARVDPYPRGAAAGLPFRLDVETVQRGLNFTLTTAVVDLDLFGEIAGGGRYENLIGDAVRVRAFGLECWCLGLEKLIEVKRAAGRPKDLEAIAELEALLEEQRGSGEA